MRRLAPVALLLVLAALAWGYARASLAPSAHERTARVEAATRAIGQALRADLARLDEATAALLADPAVAEALREPSPVHDAAALGALAARPAPPGAPALDVWRDTSLVAWSGARIPDVPEAAGGALVRTPDGRDVLVVQRRVPAGRVRAALVVRFEPYVQNRSLRPFDRIAAAAAPFDVRADLVAGEGATVPVPGLYTSLRLRLAPPAPSALVRAARTRRTDVAAFWSVLALAALALGAVQAAPRRLPRLGVQLAALALGRAALLALDVPARWLRDGPFHAAFDPARYAVGGFGGAFRSVGDLVLTALALAAAALLVARAVMPRTKAPRTAQSGRDAFPAILQTALLAAATAATAAGLTRVAERSVLDSTLDLFARSGLLPEPLVALVLAALLALALVVVLLGARTAEAVLFAPSRPAMLIAALVAFGAVAAATRLAVSAAPLVLLAVAAGAVGLVRRLGWSRLPVRRLLALLLVLAAGLYPLLYRGYRAQRVVQMEDAARTFDEAAGDPRLVFALDETLQQVVADDSARLLLALPDSPERRLRLDRRAASLARDGLLPSLGTYDVGLVLFDRQGRIAGRYAEGALPGADADTFDLDEFDLLRSMAEGAPADAPFLQPLTGRQQDGRFQTLGLVELPDSAGWATARAAPQRAASGLGTPFPRVLLPAGTDDGPGDFALALFRDGVLVRGQGRDFGQVRLDAAVAQRLATQPRLLVTATAAGRRVLTLYVQQASAAEGFAAAPAVVAVRAPALTLFDHLFFGLRVLLAGALLAALLYALGLVARRRRGLLPYRRVRFQDRVLDAFLAVGGLAVVAVAVVGVRVVTGENTRAVDDWLARSLERTEDALVLAALPGETAADVLARVPLDSLARRVGVDLSVYEGRALVRTTRPTLVREGLLDRRLPPDAALRLEAEGERFATADVYLGTFRYRVGFRALSDAAGQPRYVLSVPTLPEQERFEEEQARMLAYLFGALLLLLVALAATAALLARALAQPVRDLREGLEAVGRGRFDRPVPVASRDEIGDLGRTFNAMQAQLADSRERLAAQERQLAWGEMARQVAHEIKNPLTPMKLSVQHLRRAKGEADPAKFERMFDRVTTTLLEQIDALTRIASDFSTFGRLPRRRVERLDLRAVAGEAVRLMGDEDPSATIGVDVPEAPLWVDADHEELRRVFINLVKNALQATHGRPEQRVVVRLHAEGAEAVAHVEDTGGGIPADLVPRIFEPNFSTKTSGTGLGLAIARKAVEDSGGTIAFETEEGVGTTFTLRLPLVPEQEAAPSEQPARLS